MTLALVTLVVDDYDRAIDYYCRVLEFRLVEDTALSAQKRWVVVSPGAGGANLLLAKAAKERQIARIGDQTGGRVGFFLHTEDFEATYSRFKKAGVNFIEDPRHEPYGMVVQFEDLFGNRWDLVERR